MIPRTHLTKDFTFARSALPCVDLPPTGTKPFMPSSFLAFFRASAHTLTLLLANLFLLLAEAFLDTILPVLLLTRSDLDKPDDVFRRRPPWITTGCPSTHPTSPVPPRGWTVSWGPRTPTCPTPPPNPRWSRGRLPSSPSPCSL